VRKLLLPGINPDADALEYQQVKKLLSAAGALAITTLLFAWVACLFEASRP
jgi:hypothetical protein